MDHAFKGLVAKEYRMMRNFYITVFLVQLAYFLFIGWNATSIDELIINLSLELAIGLIILPATLLFSLNTEANQLQQFLHSPQPIHKMILAKVLNALIITLLFFVIYVGVLFVLSLLDGQIVSTWEFMHLSLWFSVSVISVSLFPTAIIFLLWVLHQWFKQFVGWGGSAVGLFILFYLFMLALGRLQTTTIYHKITSLGQVVLPIDQTDQIPFFLGMDHANGDITLYIGFYVFYSVLIIGMYFLATFILERKVEV